MAETGAVMLKRFIAWIQGVIKRMLHVNDAKRALNLDVSISTDMQEAIDLWEKLFLNKAPWLDENTQSMGLPAAIAGEFARLTVVELDTRIEGSPRADWLQQQYTALTERLREHVEVACAGGGLVFKPYVEKGQLAVDAVPAWRFLPTGFHRGQVTGAVFVERATRGKRCYTRMEHHQLAEDGYHIRNLAFRSDSESQLGGPCGLAEVDAWAELEPEVTIRYRDGSVPEGMLFSYFRIPFANSIDPGSPLGVSVYGRATDLLREADRQYSRILWEYEGSELAVDASYGALRVPEDGDAPALPTRKQRLFRQLSLDQGQGGDLYEVFSPSIRDVALFNGLDKLLKRIEFNCSLAYGTLSDPQNVDKTAEEIRSSKQRSYAAVCEIQSALQAALEHLVWTMDFYATAYRLAPRGAYQVSFTFGDGVLQDADKEFAVRKQLVDGGYLRPELLVSWYFGTSEEEARKMMPELEPELALE